MQYIFKKDGKEELVEEERWGWGVVYKNGSELKQFGDDGIFHQFQEIEQEKVEMFVMYRPHTQTYVGGPDKRIDMPVEGKQIFHFYRNFVFAMGTPMERRARAYCFGWKDRRSGETVYNFILPDDRLIISDKDVDLNKFNI